MCHILYYVDKWPASKEFFIKKMPSFQIDVEYTDNSWENYRDGDDIQSAALSQCLFNFLSPELYEIN